MELPDINTVWDYSKPEETRKKFEKIINDLDENENREYLLELKTQLARTYSLQLKIKNAHEILNEIEKDIKDDYSENLVHVRYLLERGRAYNSDKGKEKSLIYFKEAWKLAEKLNEDYYTIDALHMLGIAESDENKQIEWNMKAIPIAKASKNEKAFGWQGPLLNNTGWSLFDLKRYDEALNLFEQCAEFHKSKGNKVPELISLYSIGKTLRFQGMIDEALKIQLKIEKERELINNPGGYNKEELAELYLLIDNKERAKEYFKQAYELLSKDVWLQKNESERLERIKALSK